MPKRVLHGVVVSDKNDKTVDPRFGKMGKQAGFFGDKADKAFRKASRSGLPPVACFKSRTPVT